MKTYAEWERERSCSRKVRHDSGYDANHAVLIHWRRGEWAAAYRCDHCTGWHVTTRREVKS